MATPRNAFRTPIANQENSGNYFSHFFLWLKLTEYFFSTGIANRLLNKGGFISERKHGFSKQAFGDVKNTFKPNNGGQTTQKPTPMKVFNKQLENVKVMTPSVKNLSEEPYDKCSYKKMEDYSYNPYKNSVWTDDQMNDFIKRSNAEQEVEVPMPEPPPSFDDSFETEIPLPSLPDICLPPLDERKLLFFFLKFFV